MNHEIYQRRVQIVAQDSMQQCRELRKAVDEIKKNGPMGMQFSPVKTFDQVVSVLMLNLSIVERITRALAGEGLDDAA